MATQFEYRSHISRSMLREEPDALFVFGDNMEQRGLGGQAKEMRGEPNAVGIPTKIAPSRDRSAYFSDQDFDAARERIDAAGQRLKDHLTNGKHVVWPKDGIGTGRADLGRSSPRIWRYIEKWRNALESHARERQSVQGRTRSLEARAADLTQRIADKLPEGRDKTVAMTAAVQLRAGHAGRGGPEALSFDRDRD